MNYELRSWEAINERLKMKGTRHRVKRVKEGMRITDYGLGGKIKELKAKSWEAWRVEVKEERS